MISNTIEIIIVLCTSIYSLYNAMIIMNNQQLKDKVVFVQMKSGLGVPGLHMVTDS